MEEVLNPSADGQRKSYEFIEYRVADGVARLTLNRPQANNAMNIASLEEILSALESVDLNRDVKILLLLGGPQAFSSGLDIADHTEEKVYQMIESFHQVFHRLAKLEAVSISVVKGMALGGGCELAASCDFCLAAEDAKLGQPEIKAGIFPSIASVLYPRIIGMRRTFEMILTGRIYSAKEAERIGLVTRAVPAAEIDQEAQRWIDFLQGFSTPVLQFARRAIWDTATLTLDDAVRHVEEIYLNQLMDTEDAKEGLQAIMERRKPVWKHR